MFYSHEILTSRKHGVATIWLVATLGSKSSLKKISRRAILEVDVPKACETIADPDSPMALRLQSSLLYGVSRVFSQQCGYILTDVHSLQDKMRGMSMVMRNLQIDSTVVSSSDLLNLPTDPGFTFDVNMALDLSAFDILSESTEQSNFLSPHSFRSTQSSLLPQEAVGPQLEFPSADTPGNEFFDFDINAAGGTSSVRRPISHVGGDEDEPGIDQNPLFEITEDGVVVDVPVSPVQAGITRDADLDSRLGHGYRTGLPPGDDHVVPTAIQLTSAFDLDDDYMVMGNDHDDGLPLPPQPWTPEIATTGLPVEQTIARSTPAPSPPVERGNTETTAEAPQRRVRIAKPLQADRATEISNGQLNEWQQNYADVMLLATRERLSRQSAAQARRNATFWVLDQGIGGNMVNFGDDREPHPLSVFSGPALYEALTGEQLSAAGRKRTYSHFEDDSDEEDDNERRVRHDPAEDIGRGMDNTGVMDNDDGMLLQGDDNEVEIQVGRQPASSLKDQPSSMPWNILGSSRQGSLRGSAQPGISSSLRGIGIDLGPPSVTSGQRARTISASPLFGRGGPPSRLASLGPEPRDGSVDEYDFTDPFAGMTGNLDEDFELYGPAAAVSTQQAIQSQWLAETLETEAQNFLLFLDEQIGNKLQGGATESVTTFAELLPPAQNSNVVAAQGILHVLALATKGLIEIDQKEAYGDINLRIVRKDASEIDGGENADTTEQV